MLPMWVSNVTDVGVKCYRVKVPVFMRVSANGERTLIIGFGNI
jgi:hypothetical protein